MKPTSPGAPTVANPPSAGLGRAGLARLYVAAGAVGLVMAVVLLVEKIRIIEDPSYVPSCSINPILSCGSVMTTEQAEVFGFPNPVIGIAFFAVVATIGVALLAGAQFARWFWIGMLVGTIAGVVFVHWLAFQSLYRIGALCPYCMVVWAVTIPTFWYTLLHVAISRPARDGAAPSVSRWMGLLARNHGVIVTVWYLAFVGLVTVRFWDYWSTLA